MSARPTTLRDLVGVREQPTVVRLEECLEADWIRESYCLTPELSAHVRTLQRRLSRPTGTGVFIVGPYGCGKSHLLAWIAQKLSAGEVQGSPRDVAALSLLHYPAEARLEQVVCTALAIEPGSGDRRESWSALLDRHPDGLVLLLDELSEFLRSKPDARALNEDVRFLQYLGEYALGRRLYVVAALQEAIEHTGDLDVAYFRKIKDRFPGPLLLTQAHVRDLVADHVLVKRPGYDEEVSRLAARLARAVPEPPLDQATLAAVYPVHPATLELLEEVRGRFSQTRGVVDFVSRQLAGDPDRGIEPFLDQRWGSLLTPDAIVSHFEDVMAVQAEFLPLSQKLLPWYRRHLDELFEAEARRVLAWRVLRLLILVHLAPARTDLTLNEAAGWLLFVAFTAQPGKNREIVASVLETLVTRGRYVRGSANRYRLDLEDDGAAQLDRLVGRELASLPAPELAFELLADALPPAASGFDPLSLPRDRWVPQSYRWAHHPRAWAVWLGNGPPEPKAGLTLCVRLPWGTPEPSPDHFTLLAEPLELDAPLRELCALARVASRPLSPEVASICARRRTERSEVLRRRVTDAYARARLLTPAGEELPGQPVTGADAAATWLDRYALALLKRTFPQFERFAPTCGPLAHDAYRAFMRFLATHDLGAPHADEWVELVREGYLVPMGLLRPRAGREYTLPARLEEHDLVRQVLPLVEREPTPAVVYERLAGPIHGLVEDQISLLLVLLLAIGEIDVLKGRASYRTLFATLPTPIKYDRVMPGRALSLEQQRALERLCDALHVRRPGQWTVLAQRRAITDLAAALRAWAERLRPVLARIPSDSSLARSVQQLVDWCSVLERADDPLGRFEQLLYELGGSPDRLLSRLGELTGLPERIDRRLAELERLRHLLSQPDLRELAEVLGEPPGLERGTALDDWLADARRRHEALKRAYADRHSAWVRKVAADPLWSWEPPAVAGSSRLGLADALRGFEAQRSRVRRLRCLGLANLDFQARCTCGFDGERGPADEALGDLREQRVAVEDALEHFFAQASVRARVRSWAAEGVERLPGTLAYLDGDDTSWPEVANLAAFDEHLAGVEVVRDADVGPLVDLIASRTWTPPELLRALSGEIDRLDAPRLRFARPAVREAGPVTAWCVAMSLRHGTPLPRGLGGHPPDGHDVRVDAVGPAALRRLEDLGLDRATLARTLRLVADGEVAALGEACGAVAAARELVCPSAPATPTELAALTRLLYAQDRLLRPVAPRRWQARLEALVSEAVEPLPPPLTEVLAGFPDHAWVVVDALGLPLLPAIEAALEDLLPGWRLEGTRFALVGPETSTDAFYGALAGAGTQHPLDKIDVVDALLHRRTVSLPDLEALAGAELKVALAPVRSRLAADRPVALFADHGFRLAPDGRSWTHGGPTMLERMVPVLDLRPF